MCAVHFDAPSVATCRRCGRFCCRSCLPQLETCTECVVRLAGDLPPLENRATLAVFAMWASGGAHALMALVAGLQFATGQLDDNSPLAMIAGLAAILYLVVIIVTIVLVCRWFHLAYRHAAAHGAALEVQSPAAAVWSWFIPFINLARPFNLARQMLLNAGVDSVQVGSWQGLWLVGNVVANISSRLQGSAALGLGLVSDLALVGAAILGAQVIRSLKWQSARS
jgi:hypothetical protein